MFSSINKIFYLFSVPIFILGCTKDAQIWEIKNLNNNKIGCFGHAGMGIFYRFPINSKESLEHCFDIGSNGCEMDLQLTKDSILVLFHDTKLEDGSNGKGIINDKNWDEIKGCYHKTPLSKKTKIISLPDLLNSIKTPDYKLVFDCKLYLGNGKNYDNFLHSYANALKDIMDKHQINDRVFIESSDTNFLRILKIKDPQLNLFYYPQTFEIGLTIANRMNLFGISIPNERISKEQVEIAHQYGKTIAVWNVSTENKNIDAIEKNVDYIQSDRLKHLLKVFDLYKK